MKIYDYGLELIRVEEKHLEILRQWRNSPDISKYMEFREYITPEMQQSWFEKINSVFNFYFIVNYKDHLIGLIHLSDIDFEKQYAKAGLFISDQRFIDTHLPVKASLAILDFAFNSLFLKNIEAKVKSDNTKAINYNKALGFRFLPDDGNKSFRIINLSAKNYRKHTHIIKQAAKRNEISEHSVSFDNSMPIENEIANLLEMRQASHAIQN